MRIVFAGTPEFAVPSLEALLESPHEVVAVYTQPDRPAGRGRRLTPSPVKQRAREAGVPVEQPGSLRDPEVQRRLADYRPDLMVVTAYGLLLPREVLALPRRGCVNVHASLLPRWRGAAPIQHALLAGDTETGISLMQMEEGLDTGPVLAQAATPIGEHETAGELHDRLAVLGKRLLSEHLDALLAGSLTPVPQDDTEATYAPKLRKEAAELDWSRPAQALLRAVRAYHPWPVAWTRLGTEALRIWRAEPAEPCPREAAPGEVVAADRRGLVVRTGEGCLRLTEVQLPGGRRIHGRDLANARRLEGTRLG
ncbi:MAG: methionyl-tRNA formyltransferase [Gammaproteobacteria bacterium]|nr:MAG: methionyl-tRNA formyltransferase [Gammaproteobacteria bacterium]